MNSGVSGAFSYVSKDFWNALSSKDMSEFYVMMTKFGGPHGLSSVSLASTALIIMQQSTVGSSDAMRSSSNRLDIATTGRGGDMEQHNNTFAWNNTTTHLQLPP